MDEGGVEATKDSLDGSVMVVDGAGLGGLCDDVVEWPLDDAVDDAWDAELSIWTTE